MIFDNSVMLIDAEKEVEKQTLYFKMYLEQNKVRETHLPLAELHRKFCQYNDDLHLKRKLRLIEELKENVEEIKTRIQYYENCIKEREEQLATGTLPEEPMEQPAPKRPVGRPRKENKV